MQALTTQYMPDRLVQAFGGAEKFLALPRYEIDKSNYGMLRDYPDFIWYDEVTEPIMIGVDQYRRTFIVFKFQFVTPEKTVKLTEVLFQRYTDEAFWTSASCPCGIYSIMATPSIHYDILQQVLDNKRVVNVHNIYNDLTGDYVLG